jgi:hypothetical protein
MADVYGVAMSQEGTADVFCVGLGRVKFKLKLWQHRDIVSICNSARQASCLNLTTGSCPVSHPLSGRI